MADFLMYSIRTGHAQLQNDDRHTLVVFDDIAEVVAARVVCFAHAHGVVCEVDIAVVACTKVMELEMVWGEERIRRESYRRVQG